MPSHSSTSAAATAADEKLKIQEVLATSLGSACCATERVSAASNSRKGSSGACSTRSVNVRRRSSNWGQWCSALRAAWRRLRRITGTMSAAPKAKASPRKRNTRAPMTLGLENANLLATSTATTVRASAAAAVTAAPRVKASRRKRRSIAPRYSDKRSKGFMPPLCPQKDVDSPTTIR